MYTLLHNLLSPSKVNKKPLAVVTSALWEHFGPTKVIIAGCFQATGKTIAKYVAELQKLTTHREFGKYLPQHGTCATRLPGLQTNE